MTRQMDPYQDWDASQWAGRSADELPAPPTQQARWNKFQWVGDQGGGGGRAWRRPQDMPEGEAGFSGFRHNPSVQHWAGGGIA
jgi:hypothetical protein